MPDLAALLDQPARSNELLAALHEPDSRLVRLTGPSGSGKSYVASAVADEWLADGGRVVFGVGDEGHADRGLHPLLTALSAAPYRWSELATQGSRAAIQAADGVAHTSGAGTSTFDLLRAAFNQRSERALRPFSSIEREVISELRRMARRKPLLLIADNGHWWDGDSLWLLEQLLSDELRAEISGLDRIVVLFVDTADEQIATAPLPFARVVSLAGQRTIRTARCSRAQLSDVLAHFGCDLPLDPATLDALFSLTGGHLKLIEQVAAYIVDDGARDLFENHPDHLRTLFTARLNSLGPDAASLTALLTKAAVIGLTFNERELRCLAGDDAERVPELMGRAREIRLISGVGERLSFAHDVVRTGVLALHDPSQLRPLRTKLADCLALLRPGDYATRAQVLFEAREHERARSMLALAAVQRLRHGMSAPRALATVMRRAPDDIELHAYVRLMANGHESIAAGDFWSFLPNLRTPAPTESVLMAAERNYLAALCLMEHQSVERASEADELLGQWERSVREEPELAVRLLLLRQQAQIIAERYDAARATEGQIERRLHQRARFDHHAAIAFQIQNRRAGALSTAEVAEVRIDEAVRYFRRGTGRPYLDHVEQYRSLNNLAAIQLRLGKDAEAFATARACDQLAATAPEGLPRLDVLASNLVLAGIRAGAFTPAEAVERQRIVVSSEEGGRDKFLHRCNLAAFHLLANQDAAANEVLEDLATELRSESIDEGYLVYYAGVVEVGAAVLRGDIRRARERHREIEQFVDALKWPGAPYVRRRMLLLPTVWSQIDPSDRQAADEALLRAHPVEIGPPWRYYARLLPCSELSFWSDP